MQQHRRESPRREITTITQISISELPLPPGSFGGGRDRGGAGGGVHRDGCAGGAAGIGAAGSAGTGGGTPARAARAWGSRMMTAVVGESKTFVYRASLSIIMLTPFASGMSREQSSLEVDGALA